MLYLPTTLAAVFVAAMDFRGVRSPVAEMLKRPARECAWRCAPGYHLEGCPERRGVDVCGVCLRSDDHDHDAEYGFTEAPQSHEEA